MTKVVCVICGKYFFKVKTYPLKKCKNECVECTIKKAKK